jgi:GTPase SAR1 family protein
VQIVPLIHSQEMERVSDDCPNGSPNGQWMVNGTSTANGSATTHRAATPSVGSASRDPFLDATGEHAMMLRVMDTLRSQGLDTGEASHKKHDLPQIIVCGSQSSGKSSVLEAITAIPFPRDKHTCTRYKTRVTLERKDEDAVTIRIIPDPGRPTHERDDLKKYTKKLQGQNWRDLMREAMEEANRKIFSGSRKDDGWTGDVLSITKSAPDIRPLQLLDLPGLIGLDEYQAGNIPMLRKMVTDEMQKDVSIVLAVAKANDDLNNHSILQLRKELGVPSWRTLGVLTMPDEAGKRASTYVNMIKGENEKFREAFTHGWHVLVNRDDDALARRTSTYDRDEHERNFFQTAPLWNELDPDVCGIKSLRRKLSALLFTLAKRELPNLCRSLEKRRKELKEKIDQLGGDLSDEELQEAFEDSTERLRDATRDHIRAMYESDIRKFKGEDSIRLRSRVVSHTEAFRDRLLEDGHSWEYAGRLPMTSDIVSKANYQNPGRKEKKQKVLKSLDEARDYIVKRIASMRGEEMPGFDNSQIFSNFFWELSEEWTSIAEDHVNQVYQCCDQYLKQITPIAFSKTGLSVKSLPGFGNNEIVADRFYTNYLIPGLEQRKAYAINELKNLETDRLGTCHNYAKEYLREYLQFRKHQQLVKSAKVIQESQALESRHIQDAQAVGDTLHLSTEADYSREDADQKLHALWIHYDVSPSVSRRNAEKKSIC